MSEQPAVSRVYSMPFRPQRFVYQFCTETIGVRARPTTASVTDYPVLSQDFTVIDGEGGRLVAEAVPPYLPEAVAASANSASRRLIADGKLEVDSPRLSDDQRNLYFRLQTTSRMTADDLRALAQAGAVPVKVTVSVVARQVTVGLPGAVLPAVGVATAKGNRLSRQFQMRISLKPTDIELIRWKMNQVVQREYQAGFRVRNPSFTGSVWNTVGGGRLVEAAAGGTGGYCQEFMRWGYEWSRPFLDELFGSDYVVSHVMAGVPWVDDYLNHVANVVVRPGGKVYVLDYWMSLQCREPQVFESVRDWYSAARLQVWTLIQMGGRDAVYSFGPELGVFSELVKSQGIEKAAGLYMDAPPGPGLDTQSIQRQRQMIVESYRKGAWQ